MGVVRRQPQPMTYGPLAHVKKPAAQKTRSVCGGIALVLQEISLRHRHAHKPASANAARVMLEGSGTGAVVNSVVSPNVSVVPELACQPLVAEETNETRETPSTACTASNAGVLLPGLFPPMMVMSNSKLPRLGLNKNACCKGICRSNGRWGSLLADQEKLSAPE